MIRRLKKEVLNELPDKRRSRILINIDGQHSKVMKKMSNDLTAIRKQLFSGMLTNRMMLFMSINITSFFLYHHRFYCGLLIILLLLLLLLLLCSPRQGQIQGESVPTTQRTDGDVWGHRSQQITSSVGVHQRFDWSRVIQVSGVCPPPRFGARNSPWTGGKLNEIYLHTYITHITHITYHHHHHHHLLLPLLASSL